MLRKQLGTLRKWISDTARPALLDATLPATCAGCGRAGSWICDQCEPRISVDDLHGCQRCGRRGSPQQWCVQCSSTFPTVLTKVRAGFSFSGPMRRAVHRFKYSGEYQRGYDLGERLGQRVSEVLPGSHVDLIVPVPLHPRRFRSRGFNQAAILADAVSGVIDIPVVHAVRRVRNTTPQVRLSAQERRRNLIDAFEFDPPPGHAVSGATILLIDDVTTTGATLAAVSEALQSAGHVEVLGLALARDR